MHLCRTFATFAADRRPSPDHYCAILLPDDVAVPRFIWLKTTNYGPESPTSESEDDEDIDSDTGLPPFESDPELNHPDCGEYFGKEMLGFLALILGRFGGGMHLNHTIHLAFLRKFQTDGSKVNLTYKSLTRGGAEREYWKGPLIVHAKAKVVEPVEIKDLDMSDLTIALKGLVEHTWKFEMRRSSSISWTKIRGVKFSADTGSNIEFGTPRCKQVAIPRWHPVNFDCDDSRPSLAAALLGLDILHGRLLMVPKKPTIQQRIRR